MITFEFNAFLAGCLTVPLVLAIGLWMFYTLKREREMGFSYKQFFMQCPYCTYVYFDYIERSVPVCPRCKSFLERDQV